MPHTIRYWIYINVIFVMGLLLGIVLLTNHSTQSNPSQVNKTDTTPDFFIQGANMTTFNQQGHLISHINNDNLAYYSETQSTRVNRPRTIVYISQPQHAQQK